MTLDAKLQIQIVDAERPRLLEMLQAGSIDVAVLTGSPEDPPGTHWSPIARFALMFICSADTGRDLPLELRWSDIARLRLIGLPRDYPVQLLVDEQLLRAGRFAPAEASCNYLETQIAMVEAGVGGAVLPTSAAAACAKRDVTMHAIVDPVVWTQFCWVSSRSRTLSRVRWTSANSCAATSRTSAIRRRTPPRRRPEKTAGRHPCVGVSSPRRRGPVGKITKLVRGTST